MSEVHVLVTFILLFTMCVGFCMACIILMQKRFFVFYYSVVAILCVVIVMLLFKHLFFTLDQLAQYS
jgi:hypothetical protein